VEFGLVLWAARQAATDPVETYTETRSEGFYEHDYQGPGTLSPTVELALAPGTEIFFEPEGHQYQQCREVWCTVAASRRARLIPAPPIYRPRSLRAVAVFNQKQPADAGQ